jgi:hypothetical protein
MGTCQFIVAIAGVATNTTENYGSALAQFVFLCIYVSFFASSFGPAAWVVTGELFPLKTRAKCLSMVSRSYITVNRITNTNQPLDHRRQLVLQLAPLLHHPLPHQRSQSDAIQRLLDLGQFRLDCGLLCVLLHLRDQGHDARAGQRAVQQREQSLEIAWLQAAD